VAVTIATFPISTGANMVVATRKVNNNIANCSARAIPVISI
jgi:hypothetical protein